GGARPYRGVAIAPWASDVDRATLAAVILAHDGAACGRTARWLQGLGERPRGLEVITSHARAVRGVRPDPEPPRGEDDAGRAGSADADVDAAGTSGVSTEEERRQRLIAHHERRRWHRRCARVEVARSRWFERSDVEVIGGIPTLLPAANALVLARVAPLELRGYLVDARQQRRLDLADLAARLEDVRHLPGRHLLASHLAELGDNAAESAFHLEVLRSLEAAGYRPSREPVRLVTPRGRPLLPDIPLERWRVALELDGDRYHRDRTARRRDRDRLSAYASTDWAVLIVDHQTWMQDRPRVMADLDAAIEQQRARGIGAEHVPPRGHRLGG
ncbi:MAG: hypothetical protein WD010_05360, partial [Nitriliruptor sp.]